ncbi:hypothetical protein K4L44_03335 [Halosquirtibacter laminarini]|uniref:Uncharacterized protein n=1 Tax=Halosquirtibacter laminarini TaxID=3374600 RepID=A0AC61NGW4_9BACT|nr:hypothetical protein K4L44_03335 [Prolixibacteraceae bacterium]
MKKWSVNYIFSLLLIFIPFIGYSQSTQVVVKQRGDKKINSTVSITTETGEGVPKESEFQKTKDLYIKVVPEKGNLLFKFTKKDVDSLKQYLTIVQNKKYFWPVRANAIITSFPTKELKGALVIYDKSDLDITKPFVFTYLKNTSKAVQIKENLWRGYDTFSQLYTKGKEELKTDKYNALKKLAAFTPKSPESMKFSFSQDAVGLYNKTLEGVVKSFDDQTAAIMSLDPTDRFNTENKKKIAKLSTAWKLEVPKFVPLLDKDNKEQAEMLNQVVEINKRFSTFANGYVLQVLYDYDYNEYKFELFVNTISKMLIHSTPVDYVKGLEPIDLKVLDKLKAEKSDLAKFGFSDEFTKLVELINTNIRSGKYVLDSNVVSRLRLLKGEEKYPNYEIIDAFNSLVQKDIKSFSVKLHKVADVATTHHLVYELSGWMAALYYTDKKVDVQVIGLINQGKALLEQNNIVKAGDTFEMAFKLNRIMPITQYYIGLAYYLQGQEYTGIKFFNNSLKIEPSLTIPYVKELEFYSQEEQWEEGLEMANKALKQHPNNWYFLHTKAKMLFELNKYEESKALIIGEMIEIRPQQIGQYFLAGDIYLKQDSLGQARTWYGKAGDIDPTNLKYEEKMRDWEAANKKSKMKSKTVKKKSVKPKNKSK